MTTVENPSYTSPVYGRDENGRYRSWPLPFGPTAPEDYELAGWARLPDDEPLPLLVLPGVLHDPMEAGESGD